MTSKWKMDIVFFAPDYCAARRRGVRGVRVRRPRAYRCRYVEYCRCAVRRRIFWRAFANAAGTAKSRARLTVKRESARGADMGAGKGHADSFGNFCAVGRRVRGAEIFEKRAWGGVSHRALRKASGMDIRRIDEEGGIEAELGLKIFSFAPAAGLDFERLFKRWKLLRPDRAPQIMCSAKILRAGAKIFELARNPNKFHRKASPKAVRAPNLFRPRFCKIEASRCGAAFAYPREKMSADFQREFALENSAVFPIRLPF